MQHVSNIIVLNEEDFFKSIASSFEEIFNRIKIIEKRLKDLEYRIND